MKRALVIVLMLAPIIIFATLVDSLKMELAHADDDQRCSLMLQLASLWMDSAPDSAITILDSAITTLRLSTDTSQLITALIKAGDASRLMHHYAAAQTYFQEALTYNVDESSPQQAYIFNALGNISEELCNFDSALGYHLSSLATNLELEDLTGEAGAMNNIGNIYFNLGNTVKAEEYYRQSLKIKEELGDSLAIAGSLGNLGNISFQRGEYPKALEYYNQAKAIMTRQKDTEALALFLNNLGNLYGEMQEYQRAREHFEQSLAYYRDAQNKRGIARTLYNLGNCSYYQKEPELAKTYFLQALDDAKEIGSKDILVAAFLSMANLEEEQNHPAAALRYHRQYTALKDSIYSEETNTAVSELQMQYEMEKQNREKERYRLAAEKQKNANLRLAIGLMAVFGAGLFIFWQYRTKVHINCLLRDEIAKAVQTQKDQQQIIVHQANLTALGEMAAGIAHEINQPLQNISLSAENMEFSLSDSPPDADYLREKISYIFQDIARIRTIAEHISLFSSEQASELHQPFDINESITNALFMMRKQYELDGIHLQRDLASDIPPVMGNSYKTEQIVLNMLTNARDALRGDGVCIPPEKKVVVRSFVQDDSAVIEVQDSGCGISAKIRDRIFHPFFTTKEVGQGSGLGLSISYGIAREMGGSVELVSAANPTIFRILLPLWEKA